MSDIKNFQKKYDFIIIGGGPAGCKIAEKLKDYNENYKICIIEKDELGGVCLNRGCIPSKTMISLSNRLKDLEKLKRYGVELKETLSLDFSKFKNYKNVVIFKLKKGLQNLLFQKKIDIIKGYAKIKNETFISVFSDFSNQINSFVDLEFGKLILATGSSPYNPLENYAKVSRNIVDSEQFWDFQDLNLCKKIAIVGGGAIGCEYASSLSDLGFEIYIFEKACRLIPSEEICISDEIAKELKAKGVKLFLNVNIKNIAKNDVNKLSINLENLEKFDDFDLIIICVGRTRNLKNIGLDNIGVEEHKLQQDLAKNAVGFEVKKNIFIIGDSAGGPQLAHKAYFDAEILAEKLIFGREVSADYEKIPMVIFSNPEISRVGLTFEQAKNKFFNQIIKQIKVNFSETGRSVAENNVKGFLLINYLESGEILGVHIFGHNASELAAISSLIIENKMTLKDLQKICFAHPTFSEIFKIAAEKAIFK